MLRLRIARRRSPAYQWGMDKRSAEGGVQSGASKPPPAWSSAGGAVHGGGVDLPLELTSFIGRRAELTEARTLLGVSRLVTLTGVGGVGKTRVAMQVARRVRSSFPDGVWLVEFAELRDGSFVADVVAAALGVRTQRGRSSFDTLVDFLAQRRCLLVLDNCEQIVDAVAALVDGLLQPSPEVRILATSREILDVAGEAVLPIAPLPVSRMGGKASATTRGDDDALTLFAARAADVVPGFGITDTNRELVARICVVVEGLPLAIELAAARVRVLSLQQILQRLEDRFALLAGGPRGVHDRHQTLRATIDWSYELCSPTEQRAWTHLAVFAGSFELDAAEAVLRCVIEPSRTLDVLASLVDKSILIRGDADHVVRFRMLDTISDYARQNLAQRGDAAEWRRLHQGWYAELAARMDAGWISQDQQASIERLAREVPNLRQSLSFALSDPVQDGVASLVLVNSLFRFWLARGMIAEGRRWTKRALDGVTDGASPDRELARALFADSFWSVMQGDIDDGRCAVRDLWALSERSTIPVVAAHAAHADGFLALFTGDVARARSMLKQSLDVFVAEGDTAIRIEVLLALGWAHTFAGACAEALESFTHVVGTTEARGEGAYRSHADWGRGVVYWKIGEHDRSERVLKQGVRLSRTRGDPFMTALCMEALAWLACTRGDPRRAAVLMAAAEETVQKAGSSVVLFPALDVYHQQCARTIQQSLGGNELDVIRRQASGLTPSEGAAYALGETVNNGIAEKARPSVLTRRERDVATLVTQGMTDKEIAAELVISQRTVHGHVQHILAKLGFRSRTQIGAWIAEQDHKA